MHYFAMAARLISVSLHRGEVNEMWYLVRRAQSGDRDAFVSLMEQNKVNMYKVARSYLRNEEDIADVMQQTILDCYEHLYTLKKASYFKTWLIRILINNCIDLIHKNERNLELGTYEPIVMRDKGMDLFEFIDTLEKIDEKYRTILVLYYVEGFRIKEIADLLNMNERTVNSRLRRGRIHYKKELERSSL